MLSRIFDLSLSIRRTSTFLAACAAVTFNLFGNAYGRTNTISEDFILHCASLYMMISQAQALDHPDVAKNYGEKYDILRKEIERKFENSEVGIEQAREEIQKQIYEISFVITNTPPIIPTLIDNCDDSTVLKDIIGSE